MGLNFFKIDFSSAFEKGCSIPIRTLSIRLSLIHTQQPYVPGCLNLQRSRLQSPFIKSLQIGTFYISNAQSLVHPENKQLYIRETESTYPCLDRGNTYNYSHENKHRFQNLGKDSSSYLHLALLALRPWAASSLAF